MVDVRTLVTIASATALAALGIFLLLRKGRNATTNALATFVLGLAGLSVSYDLADATSGALATAFRVAYAAVYIVAMAGFVGLGLLVPSRLRIDSRRTRLWIVGALLGGLAYGALDLWTYDWAGLIPVDVAEPARSIVILTVAAMNVGYASVVIMLAYRGAWSPVPPQGLRSVALLGVGAVLFGASTAEAWVGGAARSPLGGVVNLAIAVASGLLWFRFGATPAARAARWTAFLILGVWTAATFAELVFPDSAYSVGRVLGTALLIYAVLRGEIAGIDAKVRFTISKGTVAGVLVAVVFIASEVAKDVFGEGQQWLGLLAGATVVFAIAPLQRLADRLAESAVPTLAPRSQEGGVLGTYEEQVLLAWSDGRLNPKERQMLRSLRDRLGLDAATAARIEDHVMERREAKE